MGTEFCKHLAEYGVMYTQAEASYRQCLNLMDTIIESGEPAEIAETLAQTLGEWLEETDLLRREFQSLVNRGLIEMVKNPESRQSFQKNFFPMCEECSFQVPRLEFPEFVFEPDGSVTFRGETLPGRVDLTTGASRETSPAPV